MLVIISCAKRQYIPVHPTRHTTQPLFQKQAHEFIQKLSQYHTTSLGKLLKISPELSHLNVERYKHALSPDVEKYPALEIFDGDVYQAMQRETWSKEAWKHAHKHLRILSGLYGYLRTDDGIPLHRLEMSTRLPWLAISLAQFWQPYTTQALCQDKYADVIINLASEDYAKAIDKKNTRGRWIDIVFWDKKKDGNFAIVGIRSKKARGGMVDAICKHAWADAEDLKKFNKGYIFSPEHSQKDTWIFIAV